MTHDEALLLAIIENPDDDTPRLVYADWLEEHAQSDRADFIRMQIRLAHLSESDPQRPELAERARGILEAHEREWLGDLPPFIERCEFRRGFIARIIAPASKFLKYPHAGEYLPLVEEAWFHGVTPRLAPALMASPFLAQLKTLDLTGNKYGDERAQAVAASPFVKGLTGLCLVRTKLTDAGVQALASCSRLARLRELDLGENRIRDEGLWALAESRYLRQLISLDLAANQKFGIAGLQAIASSRYLPHLASLDLSYNFVRDEGAAVLALSANLAGLQKLNLNSCRIGSRGARALAASPYLSGLTELDMSFNPLDDAAVEALRARFGERVRL